MESCFRLPARASFPDDLIPYSLYYTITINAGSEENQQLCSCGINPLTGIISLLPEFSRSGGEKRGKIEYRRIDFMNEDQQQEKPPKRKFWQNLLIMDSGDLKKLLSLSSLMLSFVILLVYAACYVLLMPLLDRILPHQPVLLTNLLEAVIPALVGTGAVMLTWPLFRDKLVLPAAYLWLTFFFLLIFAGVLIRLRDDPEAAKAFVSIALWEGLPSLITGNFAAWRKYRKFLWQ